MLRIKKSKVLLVLAIVFSLLFPYGAPVIAATQSATYKQSDLTGQTITMQNSVLFPQGHSYIVDNPAGTTDRMLYKIYVKNDKGTDITNAIYCLDEQKIFPGFDEDGNATTSDYKNMGDFYDASNTEVAKYIAQDNIGQTNYNAIVELTKIMYLLFQDDENRTGYDAFLNTVFGKYLEEVNKEFDEDQQETISNIKSNVGITFDDVNVIEQCAIWYFSNAGAISVTENSNVEIYDAEGATKLADVEVEYKLPTLKVDGSASMSPDRESALNMIYSYFIHTAKSGASTENSNVKLPEFSNTTPVAEVDGENYKVGPFAITSSSASKSAYKVTLTDGEIDLTNYTLKDSNGTTIDSLQDVVGKTFYVYVPISSKITNVRVGIEYLQKTTNASFWEKVDSNGNVNYQYQPLVWITNDTKNPEYKEVPIEESDLALRKYLVSINGDSSVARTPVVDATGLLSGEKTASYKHKKSPVEVVSGDKIVYELRVYNEGNTSATVKTIFDYIPSGLELVPQSESTINKTYNWLEEEPGIANTTVNKVLNKIDEAKINSEKDTFSGGLDNTYVQIEFRVKDNLKTGDILTNIAEIADDNIADRDSTTSSIDENTRNNADSYTGHKDNKTDLDDANYHYKGSEDDDDFEKVKVKGQIFDLALKKFIVAVNGKKVTDREPKVDVSPLKAGAKNANYTTNKTPLVVEQGDIVTYTLRVYNEGEKDGFAEEVADYIPEGLGFIVNYKTNIDNYWSITKAVQDGAQTVKLSTINNALNNVKLSDFENVSSLEDVEVLKGKAKITSTALNSNVSKDNMLAKFDSSKDTLSSKDIQVTCVVLADKVVSNNFKNIAEITDDGSTTDGGTTTTEVEDRDSTPDTVNPNDYPGGDADQDDNDYELLTVEEKEYDLALQKFITKISGEEVKDRIPTVTFENGKIRYNHTSEPKATGNGDLIEYTIRVYNEGKSDAYAAEVADDLPKGLEFVADNETNKKYGWQLVDKNGKVTTDANQAVTVRTTYLSKEESEKRKEDNLLKAFDSTKPISTDSKNANPDYRDLKIVFRVAEAKLDATTTTDQRVIVNIAEITEETDENGTPVIDIDSTPDNWKDDEDDLDKERIYVKYFDLALKKDLVKVIVIENGNTTEYTVNEDQLFKVEINKKKINSTVVKFVYKITVTNQGEIEGYAKEVKDYIPEGLEFVSDDNEGWYKLSDNVIATDALANTLLEANGGSASVFVTLKWINGENNLNKKVNIAEISKDQNKYNSPDIDSTPDNQVPDEDDIDDAPVLLSISTGAEKHYYGLIAAVTVIMTTGVVLIKKYVLE